MPSNIPNELYTQLSRFTFGDATTSNRLSDEDGEPSPSTSAAPNDNTPRPSVAQVTGKQSEQSFSDTASRHTFGNSTSRERHSSTTPITDEDTDYGFDEYDPDEHMIEISSDAYEDSTYSIDAGGTDDDRWAGSSSYGGRSSASSFYGNRRGSLPISIPDTASRDSSITFRRWNDESLLNTRRPSRSLEDESSLVSSRVREEGTGAISLPQSDGDWRSLHYLMEGKDARRSSLTSAPPQELANDTFDADWGVMRGGITTLNPAEFMQVPNPAQEQRRPSTISARRFSFWTSTRRSSIASTLSAGDIFMNMVTTWDRQGYGMQREAWTFRRETADGSGPLPPNASRKVSGGRRKSSVVPRANEEEVERERREKERRSTTNWKGMAPRSGEVWRNTSVGRYQVTRMILHSSDPANKAPQHRLVFNYLRDANSKMLFSSPPILIHKHSKAIAFSINRHYHSKPIPGQTPARLNTVLLAPRHVQTRFTSTTTTRRLDTHGLLHEDKDKKKHSEARATTSSGSVTSTASSTSSRTTTARTTPENGNRSSLATDGSSRQDFLARNPSSRRKKRDSLDWAESDDEESPRRTPHSETYSSIDPRQIQDRQRRTEERNIFYRWTSSRAGGQQILPAPVPVGVYRPPWITLPSQTKQEAQQRVVDNLNASFQGVGLLPAVANRNGKQKKGKKGEETAMGSPSGSALGNVFAEVPEDALMMVLPLWPGTTDAASQKDAGKYRAPFLPPDQRHYLLVSYKAFDKKSSVPPPIKEKEKKKSKSRSQSSSMKAEASSSSTSGESDESSMSSNAQNILLSAFFISARFISYQDIQGSGFKISNDGLSVSGPLEIAFATRPHPPSDSRDEWVVVADCTSRESGIAFDPEGLATLGLCTMRSAPDGAVNSFGEPAHPEPELTPLGRSVVEMTWSGGMALSSFGSIGFT